MSSGRDEALERVIPLPKEIAVHGFRSLLPSAVSVRLEPSGLSAEPRVATAIRLLRDGGMGGSPRQDGLRIECRLAGPSNGPAKEALSRRLASLPNPSQAYAVLPDDTSPERFRSLCLLANGPIGILYAVRTLLQLIGRSGGAGISFPCVSVVDWPDIGERGQWGGNTHDEVDWTAQWKLNVVEESVGLSVDAAGHTRLALAQDHISHAHAVGVGIVPYVLHLEQVALYAGLMSRTDITSRPDPSVPLPAEYVPGLCMSSPATVALVGDWMELIARYEHISAIEVWLSEDRAACFCPRCAGAEPFELEVRCIQEAFGRARAANPSLKLRILLTQGSYPVNDRVIAVAEPDVQLSYYDGGRTYDSSHADMIYPLLESYARSGRWLGVYPQITHCWRTVFPWSAPQLIAARAREFADKGLSNVIGYAVPSNRHHELNVMALAEWTWNSRGRSPEELARAYARWSGIGKVEEFGRWAAAAGEAGWWLAESRMLLRFIYNYDVDLDVGAGVEDHRFRQAGLSYDRPTIESALARAQEAREISRAIGHEPLIEESDALYAGLAALLAIDELNSLLASRPPALLAETLDRLDRASAVLCRSVSSWGARINARLPPASPAAGSMWVRMRDTTNVLFRVCDTLRRKEELRGVPDPHASRRERRLGGWSASDFDSKALARLSFDVTEALEGEGSHFFVCFTYEQGQYAAEIRSILLRREGAGGASGILSRTIEAPMRVGRWEKWHELSLVLPPSASRETAKLLLEVELAAVILEGRRPEAWECRGEIGLRAAWPEDTRI